LVHTQLVGIGAFVPSHAGLGDGRSYAHSSVSPLHEPPGVIAVCAGHVPTSLQPPRAPAPATAMAASTAASVALCMSLIAEVTA
jgi:hypothetical protein